MISFSANRIPSCQEGRGPTVRRALKRILKDSLTYSGILRGVPLVAWPYREGYHWPSHPVGWEENNSKPIISLRMNCFLQARTVRPPGVLADICWMESVQKRKLYKLQFLFSEPSQQISLLWPADKAIVGVPWGQLNRMNTPSVCFTVVGSQGTEMVGNILGLDKSSSAQNISNQQEIPTNRERSISGRDFFPQIWLNLVRPYSLSVSRFSQGGTGL